MRRLVTILLLSSAAGFSPCRINSSPRRCAQASSKSSTTRLKYDLRDEIENAAQRRAYENKAKGDGVGSAVAGAALGGLLGGPFGLLVSSSLFSLGSDARSLFPPSQLAAVMS